MRGDQGQPRWESETWTKTWRKWGSGASGHGWWSIPHGGKNKGHRAGECWTFWKEYQGSQCHWRRVSAWDNQQWERRSHLQSYGPCTVRSLAFTNSEVSSLSMVLNPGVAGSHWGFKGLTLATVLRACDRRESVARTCSNHGAQLITSSNSALQRGNTSLGSICCQYWSVLELDHWPLPEGSDLLLSFDVWPSCHLICGLTILLVKFALAPHERCIKFNLFHPRTFRVHHFVKNQLVNRGTWNLL